MRLHECIDCSVELLENGTAPAPFVSVLTDYYQLRVTQKPNKAFLLEERDRPNSSHTWSPWEEASVSIVQLLIPGWSFAS